MIRILAIFCLLPLPQNSGQITSSYGWRKIPSQPQKTFHRGIDIRAPMGTPVRAVRAGKVAFAAKDTRGGGLMIDIATSIVEGRHITRYAHLNKILVKKNERVKKGQTIGLVGSTGFSTGPHLHFETFTVLSTGSILYYDPMPWVCPYKMDLQVPHFKGSR